MSEKHPIRNGIISTVIGGAVLALLGLVWPPIWNVLGTVVRVPLWVVAVVAIGGGALVRGIAGRQRPALPTPTSRTIDASAPPMLPQAPLNPLERKVFQRLVKADGAWVSFNALLRTTGTSRLRLQAELERLDANDLIDISADPTEGDTEVFLTPRGRQYVVQLGLV